LLDPIGIHEALASTGGPAYCPLAYGYAHYGSPNSIGKLLRWADAPAGIASSQPGTVLGGTGLAVARRSAANPRVAKWIRAFMAPAVQSEFVPTHGGQPAHRLTWTGPGRADYYAATVSSMLKAWTRPRDPGWISFQDSASEAIRDCLTTGSSAGSLVVKLNRLWPDDRGDCRL
jgi:multiple sugar transport system substrate-binding protein